MTTAENSSSPKNFSISVFQKGSDFAPKIGNMTSKDVHVWYERHVSLIQFPVGSKRTESALTIPSFRLTTANRKANRSRTWKFDSLLSFDLLDVVSGCLSNHCRFICFGFIHGIKISHLCYQLERNLMKKLIAFISDRRDLFLSSWKLNSWRTMHYLDNFPQKWRDVWRF